MPTASMMIIKIIRPGQWKQLSYRSFLLNVHSFEDDDNDNAGVGFVNNVDNHDDIANLIIRLASAG